MVWCVAILTIALVSVADWFSGAEVAASLLYLLPIGMVAWSRGRGAAQVVALVSALAWLAIDLGSHWDSVVTALEAINALVLLTVFSLVGQLLATLRQRLERERLLAHTDALTGLNNRRAFWNATLRELQRCQRFGEPFSLAYIDVDRFKSVNDRHGHGAGDELLRRIAGELQVDMRDLDMVARLGGDEFAVLLPGTSTFGAKQVLARLRQRLQHAPWRQAVDIDFSIGCLTVLTPPTDVDAVVRRADRLMYETKAQGSGRTRHAVLQDDTERPITTITSIAPGATPAASATKAAKAAN